MSKQRQFPDTIERYIIDMICEDGIPYIKQCSNYGCASGSCGGMVRNDVVLPFFEAYAHQINKILARYMQECGEDNIYRLIPDLDEFDPLMLGAYNRAHAAWLAFEIVLSNITSRLDEGDYDLWWKIIASYITSQKELKVFRYDGEKGTLFQIQSEAPMESGTITLDTASDYFSLEGEFFTTSDCLELDIMDQADSEELLDNLVVAVEHSAAFAHDKITKAAKPLNEIYEDEDLAKTFGPPKKP